MKIASISAPLFLLLVLGAALGTRLFHLTDESIWMDEAMQSKMADRNPFDPILTAKAAVQQQPPLDYFFQAIAFQNFGITPTGARIHSAIGGTLTVMLFLVAVMIFTPNRFVWIAATLLIVSHPVLIRYSQEGRPVSTAILFATFQLLYITKLIFHPDAFSRPAGLLAMIFIQTGLLLSIGFQPIVYLVTSGLSLIPFLFSSFHRHAVLRCYLTMALAFAAALPLLQFTIDRSGRLLHNRCSLSMLPRTGNSVKSLTTDALKERYAVSLGHAWIPSLITTLLGIIAAWSPPRALRLSRPRFGLLL